MSLYFLRNIGQCRHRVSNWGATNKNNGSCSRQQDAQSWISTAEALERRPKPLYFSNRFYILHRIQARSMMRLRHSRSILGFESLGFLRFYAPLLCICGPLEGEATCLGFRVEVATRFRMFLSGALLPLQTILYNGLYNPFLVSSLDTRQDFHLRP